MLATSASAQDTTPTDPSGRRQTPSWTGGDIVVTGQRQTYAEPDTSAATKTDTPLINVPQSVQVLNKTLIEEQDRRTIGDALVNVAGVTPTRSEEVLFTAPIIHGFPAEIYQDGLPFYGATQAANDPTSLVGVERIDVVKGPVSTLYAGGVGTPLGGLINIESVRPYDTLGGYVAIRGGSFGTVDPYADLNVPLAPGIAARITGEYQRNDSYIDQVHGNRWSVQPSLSFQLFPRTDLFVQGKFDRRSQLEYSGIPAVQALARQIDRNAFPGASNDQPNNVIDNKLATAILRHSFSDDVKLTVSGRWYRNVSRENGAFVYGDLFPPDPAAPTTYEVFAIYLGNRTTEATLDANLQTKVDVLGGRHELLGGFNYDRTRFFSGLGFTGEPLGTQDLANPSYTLAYGTPPPIPTSPVLGGTATDRYETVAGYIQDQATYGPLHLTGSLRFTSLRFRELETGTDRNFRRVSPRVGATLDVVPGVALYAGYATAFRGAFGVVSLTPPKPETARNVEAGLKLGLARAHLSGTIAVFEQTRRNVATPDPNDIHYARVSTTDQDLGIQEAALRAAGCQTIRSEKKSGTERGSRTELQILLDFLREGDTLVVTRIDRLARSMKDLQDIVHELKGRGVALKATEQPIDTGTAAGKAFLDMLGVFAEFETNLRKERQAEGIQAAKARGVYKGGKPRIDPEAVRRLAAEGVKPAHIARQLGISRGTVYRLLPTATPA